MARRPAEDVRVRSADRTPRSADKAARTQVVPPLPPRNVVSARRGVQARPSVVQAPLSAAPPTRREAPAPRSLRKRRAHGATRPSPPSGRRRLPAQLRPLQPGRRSRRPQSAHCLPPRRLSAPLARPPRSVNGTATAPPPSAIVLDSQHLPPRPLRALRLRRQRLRHRRLNRQRLRPRHSSGLPQVRLARPMRSGPPARETPSGLTASAGSVRPRMRPPRPRPQRLLRRPHHQLRPPPLRHPLLRRLPPPLRQPLRPQLRLPPRHRLPQREPSLQLRLHPRRSRRASRLHPQPSRSIRPVFASRICAISGVSGGKVDGLSSRSPATAPLSARATRS